MRRALGNDGDGGFSAGLGSRGNIRFTPTAVLQKQTPSYTKSCDNGEYAPTVFDATFQRFND
jgi:hypothetical protein